MRPLFVVNARSGAVRRRDLPAMIRRCCDIAEFDVRGCDRKSDLDAIVAQARRDGFDTIVAVGGDGTVHETARRLIGSELALGIIPTGSGNGFARHMNLPGDPGDAVRALTHAHRVSIDTAVVNGEPFIGVMGIGFDAAVAHRFAEFPERGLRTYVRAGLGTLGSYESERYSLLIDGEQIETDAMLVTIANTSQYGNDARIAPNASVTDGLLDVVIVRDAGLLRAPLLLAQLFAGTIDQSPAVIVRRAREVTVHRSSAPAHLDGEPVLLSGELNVRVVPRSLDVLVTKDP